MKQKYLVLFRLHCYFLCIVACAFDIVVYQKGKGSGFIVYIYRGILCRLYAMTHPLGHWVCLNPLPAGLPFITMDSIVI